MALSDNLRFKNVIIMTVGYKPRAYSFKVFEQDGMPLIHAG